MKKKMFLVTPDSEQGLYCETKEEVLEFIKNWIEDDSDDKNIFPVSFEIEVKEMTEEEIAEIPEYIG